MVDHDLVAAQLAELLERIVRAQKHCPETAEALARDRDALDLVAFNLMLAVQTCAALASHIIADEGLPAAKTLAASFDRLVEHGYTTAATAEQLKRAVGLRNVVAHGYARVNVEMVHTAATKGVADLHHFAADIARRVVPATAG